MPKDLFGLDWQEYVIKQNGKPLGFPAVGLFLLLTGQFIIVESGTENVSVSSGFSRGALGSCFWPVGFLEIDAV